MRILVPRGASEWVWPPSVSLSQFIWCPLLHRVGLAALVLSVRLLRCILPPVAIQSFFMAYTTATFPSSIQHFHSRANPYNSGPCDPMRCGGGAQSPCPSAHGRRKCVQVGGLRPEANAPNHLPPFFSPRISGTSFWKSRKKQKIHKKVWKKCLFHVQVGGSATLLEKSWRIS